MSAVAYISIEEALELHAVILGLTRGTLGVRDMGALLGSLERPRTAFGGRELFPGLFLKAAALIESVARNHPLIDGNKRTSYLIGAAFLEKNGYDLAPKTGEIETLMLWIGTEKPATKEIAAWLKKRSGRRGK